MVMIVGLALADPCVFTGVTDGTTEAEELAAAWDEDRSTWASGNNFSLGLTMGNQILEQVGAVVGTTEPEVSYSLEVWYLPEGGTEYSELLAKSGTLPSGTNVGQWSVANVEADELLWVLNTNSENPVGFQVICESGPTYNFQGGGGCTGQSFGLSPAGFLLLPLSFLRRRKG